MIRYELKKLISPLTVTMLIVIFAVRILISFLPYQYDIAYSKSVYKEYMRILGGNTADEASDYIESEKAWLDAALNVEITDEIPLQQQFSALEDLSEAQRKSDAFDAVYEKYIYFCQLEQDERKPVFFYDLDWKEFLNDDKVDLFYLLILAIVIIPYFTNDYGKIHPMLFCTVYGRKRLICIKLALIVVLSGLIAILFNLSDVFSFAVQYGLDNCSAPVYSIQAFERCVYELSLWEFLILKDVINIIWSISAALLSACIALSCKNPAFSSFLLIISIFIPYLIGSLLPVILKALSIGGNLSGHTVFQGGNAVLISIVISYLVHTVLLYRGCITLWCKNSEISMRSRLVKRDV